MSDLLLLPADLPLLGDVALQLGGCAPDHRAVASLEGGGALLVITHAQGVAGEAAPPVRAVFRAHEIGARGWDATPGLDLTALIGSALVTLHCLAALRR